MARPSHLWAMPGGAAPALPEPSQDETDAAQLGALAASAARAGRLEIAAVLDRAAAYARLRAAGPLPDWLGGG
jgi:hypothetical protein